MDIQIAPLSEGGLHDVVALSLRAWEPVFQSLKEVMEPELFDHFYPDWRAVQAQAVTAVCTSVDHHVWTAACGSSVAGFVAVKLDRKSALGEVYMIAVDPAAQRSGVGSALLEHALAWLKDNRMSVAMVETGADPGHAPARRLYERAGFSALPAVRYFRKL
jgi:GNAT superfamily N-acetyltransferase